MIPGSIFFKFVNALDQVRGDAMKIVLLRHYEPSAVN